jgi:DNA-binding CsgD family transcriptional regulator
MRKNVDWRPFAERLTELAKAEGHDRFLDHAFSFLNDYVAVDSCAVFKVAADKISGAEHLCTFGTLPAELAENLAQGYISNGFKADPMVQTALISPNVRVRRLPHSHYSNTYRSQYFERAKLVDKVTSIHSSKNVLFLVNFYRIEGNGVFTSEGFKDLQRLAPIIGRFVLRHVRLKSEIKSLPNAYEERIAHLVQDNTQVFSHLSMREGEVCKNILLGIQEKDIATLLNITLNTVVTYRRRIYAKLNISSKSELFQLALISQN